MAQYLSEEWFNEMSKAGAGFTVDSLGAVSLREIVTDAPTGSVSYVMHIVGGKVAFDHGDEAADVTFTQTYDTAVALHKGELTIRDAFFTGRVRVAGHLNTLLDHSDLLQGVAPAFKSVRATTTY